MEGEQIKGAGRAAGGRGAGAPAGEYAEWARQVNRTLADLERRVADLELERADAQGGAAPAAAGPPPAGAAALPLPRAPATGGDAA